MTILGFFGESDTSVQRKTKVNFKNRIQNGWKTSDYKSKRSAPPHFFSEQLSSKGSLLILLCITWSAAAPASMRCRLTDFCSGAVNFLPLQEQPAKRSAHFQRAVLALALTEVQFSNVPRVTDKSRQHRSHRKGRELSVKRRTKWRTYALFSPEAVLIRLWFTPTPCGRQERNPKADNVLRDPSAGSDPRAPHPSPPPRARGAALPPRPAQRRFLGPAAPFIAGDLQAPAALTAARRAGGGPRGPGAGGRRGGAGSSGGARQQEAPHRHHKREAMPSPAAPAPPSSPPRPGGGSPAPRPAAGRPGGGGGGGAVTFPPAASPPSRQGEPCGRPAAPRPRRAPPAGRAAVWRGCCSLECSPASRGSAGPGARRSRSAPPYWARTRRAWSGAATGSSGRLPASARGAWARGACWVRVRPGVAERGAAAAARGELS